MPDQPSLDALKAIARKFLTHAPVERRSLGDEELPELPERPTMFEPQPTILSPELAQSFEGIRRLVPDAGRGVSRIQFGPNAGTAMTLMDSGFRPDQFDKTNLLGFTENDTNNISLRPSGNYDVDETLAHELAHAAGSGELAAGTTGRAYGEYKRRTKK